MSTYSADGQSELLIGQLMSTEVDRSSIRLPSKPTEPMPFLIGSDGSEIIEGTIDSDFIGGLGGDDELHGEAGNDIIEGDDGADHLYGGDGDDLLDPGSKPNSETFRVDPDRRIDEAYGGDGFDTLKVSGRNLSDLRWDGRFEFHETIVVGSTRVASESLVFNEIERLYLGSGPVISIAQMSEREYDGRAIDQQQVVVDTADADLIRTSNLADVIFSTESVWSFENKAGDTVYAGAGNDSIYGGDVFGRGSQFARLFGEGGDDYIDVGQSSTVSGGADQDTLVSKIGANLLKGDAGDDVIRAMLSDTAYGGSGNDILESGAWASMLSGDGGDDVIRALYLDTASGGDGNDTIESGSGKNVLKGDGGHDLFRAAAGDSVFGGSGTDTIVVDHLSSVSLSNTGFSLAVAGRSYTDEWYKGAVSIESVEILRTGGSDFVLARAGKAAGLLSQAVVGTDGRDNVIGGQAADLLFGGNGNDKLVGGRGADTMYGGDGDDLFRYNFRPSQGVTDGNDVAFGGHGTDVFRLVLDKGTAFDLIVGEEIVADLSLAKKAYDLNNDATVRFSDGTAISLSSVERLDWTFI